LALLTAKFTCNPKSSVGSSLIVCDLPYIHQRSHSWSHFGYTGHSCSAKNYCFGPFLLWREHWMPWKRFDGCN